MAILKKRYENNYTMVPNFIIDNREISNNAFRLIVYLYSKPNNWIVNQNNIAKDLDVTRKTIQNWVFELKQLGLLTIERNGNEHEYCLEIENVKAREKNCVSKILLEQNLGEKNITQHNKTNSLSKTDIYTKTDILVGQTDTSSQDNFNTLCKFIDSKLDHYKIGRDRRIEKVLKKTTVEEIIKANYTFEDIERTMAYFKIEWQKPKMAKFYRVSTLFNTEFPKRIYEAVTQDLDMRVLDVANEQEEEELTSW